MVGNNGVGKSTLARALCGLIESKGRLIATQSPKHQIQQDFFMVMQDVNHQLFAESVFDELFVGLSDKSNRQAEALALLEQLDLPAYKDCHPLALSGGQKQRVAIASAIFSGCIYLIFDEPTSGLDYHHMMAFANLIHRVKEQVLVVLIISRDYELINNCCDSVLELRGGQLIKHQCHR